MIGRAPRKFIVLTGADCPPNQVSIVLMSTEHGEVLEVFEDMAFAQRWADQADETQGTKLVPRLVPPKNVTALVRAAKRDGATKLMFVHTVTDKNYAGSLADIDDVLDDCAPWTVSQGQHRISTQVRSTGQ